MSSQNLLLMTCLKDGSATSSASNARVEFLNIELSAVASNGGSLTKPRVTATLTVGQYQT